MKIVLCCLLLALLFHPGQSIDQSAESFRIIPIPAREHGYNNFSTVAFMSQEDLDSFLNDTSKQMGWNSRQHFEDALLDAKLDFSKEALVLLRHTEGSGSVQVTFETPFLRDRNLLCEIKGQPIQPGYAGTADMAYYCFAVAVSKKEVSNVVLQATEGGFSNRRLDPMVLPITEESCPRISVTCPDALAPVENNLLKFKADFTAYKARREISYNWTISKGTITRGQGTAEIEVDFGKESRNVVTATVEVKGFASYCNRLASCTTSTH